MRDRFSVGALVGGRSGLAVTKPPRAKKALRGSYLRIAGRAIALSSICDRGTLDLDHHEDERIRTFSVDDLSPEVVP